MQLNFTGKLAFVNSLIDIFVEKPDF